MMREDDREPLSMGGASIIIIFTAFVMSIIIVFMVLSAYQVYKADQDYVMRTQAYYVADGEATIKRALIEERLYKLYYSKAELAYDIPHITKVIKDIKGIEVMNQDEKTVYIQYEEPINEKEKLVIKLATGKMKSGLDINRFTHILKWQVETINL